MRASKRGRRARGAAAHGFGSAGFRPTDDQFVAASGLRPLAAYAFVGAVFAAVAIKAAWIHTARAGQQPEGLADTTAPWPRFELLDRRGQPLALSVECFDLTVSPRALWRSHTPLRVAEAISNALGDMTLDEVLAALMPPEFRDGPAPGWLELSAPRLLALDEEGAMRARLWIATGKVNPDDAGPDVAIEGFQVVPLLGATHGGPAGLWTIAWEPALALSDRQRVRQLGLGGEKRPERWTRRLLDGLLAVVGGDEAALALLSEVGREPLLHLGSVDRRAALHEAIWAELMPSRFRVVARRIDAVRAHVVAKLLTSESISAAQADLHARLDRKHPTRPAGQPAPPSATRSIEVPEDAFTLLGHWGVLDPGTALRVARRTREERPYLLPWEEPGDPLDAYTRELEQRWRPWSGLELRAQVELEDGPWTSILDERSRAYYRRVRSVARDRRAPWRDLGRLPDYFTAANDAADVPRVHATLDAGVQEMLHRELSEVLGRERAALAMGIVVDVATGDVLALDYTSRYPYSGFAPLRHVFTPGSTFKAIVMAIALDRGYVAPTTVFPTYAGTTFYVRGSRRSIGEAEGAPTARELTAAEGLAHSCNAVLVQIGLRVPASVMREAILSLGYGQRPSAQLGPEMAGLLTPLDPKIPGGWREAYTHASVSFGHEIGVTLWQHAEALATVARGGMRRPLRVLSAIDQGELRWDLPLEESVRVLSERACDDVRAMMNLGATVGTGDKIAHPSMHPELAWIGTKTGTTEKVPSELCLHVELPALAAHAERGTRMSDSERKALSGRHQHFDRKRGVCYTSSMVAIGRNRDGRELLTLIVIEDPTGPERYGSRVAGPTAIAVLRQAFGLPRSHVTKGVARDERREALVPASFSESDLPWAESAPVFLERGELRDTGGRAKGFDVLGDGR